MFNMFNEVKVRHSSGNMFTNEKFKCLAHVTHRPIYEKRIGGVTWVNSPTFPLNHSLTCPKFHCVIMSSAPTRLAHWYTCTPFVHMWTLHLAIPSIPSTMCPQTSSSHLTDSSTIHHTTNPPHHSTKRSPSTPTHVLPDPYILNHSPFSLCPIAYMHLYGTHTSSCN